MYSSYMKNNLLNFLYFSYPNRIGDDFMNETDFRHDLHNLKFNAWSEFKKTVVQYDKNEKRIRRYESIMEASRTTGICYGSIMRCCKTYRGTAGGYKWLYADI
jgi:hypothetical protein